MKALAAMLFAGAWLLVAACGTDSAPGNNGSSGGRATGGGGGVASVASATAASFRRSACFACVEEDCASELENCAFDPGCSGHVACAFSCPGTEHAPEPSCVSRCPKPQNSVSDQEIALLFECIQTTRCVECRRDGSAGGVGGTGDEVAAAGTGASSAGGAGSCEPLGMPQDECDACGHERCCEEKIACRSSAECEIFGTCFRECYLAGGISGAECRARCKEQGTGDQTYFRYVQCGIGLCGSSCGGTEDPCSRCAVQNCSEFYRTCLANSACLELTICLLDTHGAVGALEACFAAHPSGTDLYGLYGGCIERDCAAVCG